MFVAHGGALSSKSAHASEERVETLEAKLEKPFRRGSGRSCVDGLACHHSARWEAATYDRRRRTCYLAIQASSEQVLNFIQGSFEAVPG